MIPTILLALALWCVASVLAAVCWRLLHVWVSQRHGP